MQSRLRAADERLVHHFKAVVAKARVFQGGGHELTVTTLKETVQGAADKALVRKFPKFPPADHAEWPKVAERARNGADDALALVGHNDDVLKHPVCKEVFDLVLVSGTKGADIRTDLGGGMYGWPQDAVDGALYALLSKRHIRAEQDNTPLAGAKQLISTQIGKTTFFKEDDPPSKQEQLAVRGLMTAAHVDHTAGQEGAAIGALLQRLKDLADRAGGAPPLPEVPDTSHIDQLLALAGNKQVKAVAAEQARLRADHDAWSAIGKDREERLATWQKLDGLLGHAEGQPVTDQVKIDRDAIAAGRQLMQSPDPVAPLVTKVSGALRAALTAAVDAVNADATKAVADLEGSADWAKLSDADRQQILAASNLAVVAPPAVATDDELLHALNSIPLTSWGERRQLVATRLNDARVAVAKLLEPASVEVALPKVTIRTTEELDTYLASLKAQLDAHIAKGETIVLK
jgi:hypothetical protein